MDRIKKFLACGGVLNISCPGCGKVMSRQRNLVGVQGSEVEEHTLRYSKENIQIFQENPLDYMLTFAFQMMWTYH